MIKRIKIRPIPVGILIAICLLLGVVGKAYAGQPLIVSIDNPNFRRLVMAIPDFLVEKDDPSLKDLPAKGAEELSRLLTFSGFFNILASEAYKDLVPGLVTNLRAAKQPAGLVGRQAPKGIQGVDSVQWKSVGVESLTIGELEKEAGGIGLSLRTVDLNRNQLVLGKKYSKIQPKEFHLVIRRYADLLLKEYTGKPGIFSSKLVFIGRKAKGVSKQVYLADFDGSNSIQITSGNYPHLSPAWSPDAKHLLFTSYEKGNPDLYIYDLATGQRRLLSGHKGLNSGGFFAPNNKVVAYTGSDEGDANLYLIQPNGQGRKLLVKGSGLDVDPAFSPDQKWLAFVSGRFGNPHIFRAKLEWQGDDTVKVIEDKRLTYAGWYNATPAWSPEADKLAFAGYDKDIDRFDLFMMNHDGTNLERLTIRAGDNESPSWSANGQMILFQSNRVGSKNEKATAQLWVMNRDGSNQRQLETGLYESQTPKWSGPIE